MHSWLGHWSLRARLTAAATLTLSLLLSAAAALLVWGVHDGLLSRLDMTAKGQALTLAAAVSGSTDPRVPARSGLNDLSQIIDAAGKVVAASPDIQGEPRLFDFPTANAGSAPVVRTVKAAALNDATYRVAAVSTSGPAGYQVYVGLPLAEVSRSTRALAVALAAGVPGLVAALAVLTWVFAGRALRPVEIMRRQAADITIADLERRVDVPPSRDELSRLATTLNDLLNRLDESVRRQRQFVADAAHELRSPVAAIRSQLEVADSINGGEPSGLTGESVRLSLLVDDLLALARIDASPQPQRKLIDLDDLVYAEAQLLRERTDLTVDLFEIKAAQVLGDPGLLTRAVRNLLDNAARFATTQIAVSLTIRGSSVELTVADDGPGIAEADRSRVLERFTRLDSARTRDSGGVGLGLAIVNDVVALHAGRLLIEDNEPGARIIVSLPTATT